MKEYILSIDQGTTSTKILLYDLEGNEKLKIFKPIQILTPERSWVEHSPKKIFLSIVKWLLIFKEYCHLPILCRSKL